MDTMARGEKSRLDAVIDHIDLRTADVRDIDSVRNACKGADVVFHLAVINGTENFYKHPDLVLDVGLRGALAVVEGPGTRACPIWSSPRRPKSTKRPPSSRRMKPSR